MNFETFVSRDGLHMNDWSYACFAKGLGLAIAEAAERPVHVGDGHVAPDDAVVSYCVVPGRAGCAHRV